MRSGSHWLLIARASNGIGAKRDVKPLPAAKNVKFTALSTAFPFRLAGFRSLSDAFRR